MVVPQNLRIGLPHDGYPLLGIYLKNLKTHILKNICTPMITTALFTVANTWKQPQYPSIGDWIKKMGGVYTMEHHSATRTDEILPFVTTWMDLENMLNKIVETEKVKNHMIPLIGGV